MQVLRGSRAAKGSERMLFLLSPAKTLDYATPLPPGLDAGFILD